MIRIYTFSFIISLVLIALIIWASYNLVRIRRKMNASLKLPIIELAKDKDSKDSKPSFNNDKWQNVIVHINSKNPGDWKLAILECDIMLGDLLTKKGYVQESIGEQLKAMEPGDLINIDAAWEAHKIRNMIAHEGSDFMINEREAKRVIGLYEAVFQEFEHSQPAVQAPKVPTKVKAEAGSGGENANDANYE